MKDERYAFPVSFAQRRLWFLDRLEPGSARYNLSHALAISGPLDISALQRTLDAVVARHEALRTTFGVQDGEPVQVVHPPPQHTLQSMDFERTPAQERPEAARRQANAEAQHPFDLERGPLFRSTLLRLRPHEHVLILALHHIVSDGWSMAVLFREIATLYRAFSAGQPCPLPPPPLQYADFAVWQRDWLSGETYAEQLAYWKDALAGAPPTLELAADFRASRSLSHPGSVQVALAPTSLLAQLRALSEREGVTLFMTLLAAFDILLARYTGQNDIVVATPMAGRVRPELEGLIGFFVNTLVLRGDLSGNPPFTTLLRRIRDTALGAYAHQDLPFERLIEELRPERVQHRNPLFQVMFAMQNMPRQELELPGLTLRRFPLGHSTAKFDLTLFCREDRSGLRCALEYPTDRYAPATIARMLEHYRILLEGIVAEPGRRISALPLLDPAESRQVAHDWNATRTAYPRHATVHGLFEAQVRLSPDALAVVGGDERITYSALNQRAGRLARLLRCSGVGPDVPVAVAVERSPALVVALLAILKAGGAYLPLDPDYPRERLASMLKDAGVGLLITERRLLKAIPPGTTRLLCLDGENLPETVDETPAASCPGVGPENLAYVMYTSGSTGVPKGIAVTHRAIVRLVRNTDYVQLGTSDRVAQVSNASFDAATFEVWGALLNGAVLDIIPREVSLSPRELAAALRKHDISAMFLTTALFNQIAGQEPGAFACLRHLLFGGEAVDPRPVAEVLRRGPPGRLLHVYGPTESTTFATWYQVPSPIETAATIPIGRPIANTRAYLLDGSLEPVPVGVPGELYLGGDGLARGYLGRPALTAERFVPDRFSQEAGGRLYRTGDVARWRPDGVLEFLGRKDQQVKIRGYRIEPGEIQAVLTEHPEVRDAVVIPREDSPGERRLAAYVVPREASDGLLTELQEYLGQRLPRYMLPSALVLLGELPLTANGKVDRSALPFPEARQEVFVPPGTASETRLAAIWAELLGLEPVGSTDDFFAIGGHSLLAVKLFSRIEAEFGLRLPVATLFQHRRLRQLAAEIDRATHREAGRAGVLVPLQPRGHNPPLVLIHNVWGGLLRYRLLAGYLGPDHPVYGFEASSLDGGTVPIRTLEEIADDYVRELEELQPEGPYYLCGYCAAGALTLEIAQRLHAAGGPVKLVAIIDGACPRPTTLVDRLARNLGRIRMLQPRDVAGFLRRRLMNLGLDLAYRLSLRLRRPLLTAFQGHHGVLSHATRHYRPGRYPGRITLIRSMQERRAARDPFLGWDAVAAGGVELRWVPGDHFTIMQEPLVGQLAAELRSCLNQTHAPVAGESG